MTTSLTPDIRNRLDAHLDAVESALAKTPITRDQRRGIVDDLESQILDMLAAKSPSPTLADVETLLAQLDPPAAYADTSAVPSAKSTPTISAPPSTSITAPTLTPHYSRAAITAAVLILLSILSAVIFVPLSGFLHSSIQSHNAMTYQIEHHLIVAPDKIVTASPADEQLQAATTPAITAYAQSTHYSEILPYLPFLLITFPLALIGTFLGWIAFFRIRRSKGFLYGYFPALFAGLFWPLAALIIIPFFTTTVHYG